MFYTNFGAATSILLILGMIGLLSSELVKMFSLTELTLRSATIPIEQKDRELDSQGALFMFGYRILDENGDLFEDNSILRGVFVTNENIWNNETNSYVEEPTTYFQGDCLSVF